MVAAVAGVLRAARSKRHVHHFSRVQDSTGKLAQGPAEEKAIFREHFTPLLGGVARSFESLVSKDRSAPDSRFTDVHPSQLSQCVPTPNVLSRIYRGLHKGKGFGEGLICTDVFKEFPNEMSRIQFSLVLKSFVRVQPPLQWKGGMLCELFKMKGSPSVCGNYRDVLLADDSGKAVGRLIRSRLLPGAMALSVSTQFGGGLNGGETAFAHLYLRLMIDAAVNTRTSCSIIFLDVVAAFAQMLRRIVFRTDDGDEAWLASLAAAGFSEEDISIIYSTICSSDWVGAMLDSCNADAASSSIPMDFRFVEQSFSNGWVSQDYIPNILQVTKGSGAGTPFADLVYSMAMSRVLIHMRKVMEDDGLSSVILETYATS